MTRKERYREVFWGDLTKDQLESCCEKVTETGCWIWMRTLTPSGYARRTRSAGPKLEKVHHTAYKLWNGEIAPGLFVLHRCDVRCCVNPKHLFLGTIQDNATDMVRKGRSARGTMIGTSKLKPEQVLEIRASQERVTVLARRYSVSRRLIDTIRARITWKYL